MVLMIGITYKMIKPGKATGLNYKRVMKKKIIWFNVSIRSHEKSVNSL
jgi:hypothetical protein